MADKKNIPVDEIDQFIPKWNDSGLITAVAIDHKTQDVLMVAHMNEEALRMTLASGDVVYWSRSRQKLWRKGESSGHVQKLKEMRVDCDQDCLLLFIEQEGAACHTGRRSCFYRQVLLGENGHLIFLDGNV